MPELFFDDLEPGDERECGSYTVTKAEIIAFARQYDPQPFHLDETAAEESIYGGLIASGWHTAAVSMRLYVDGFLRDTASMGARGVDELRWRRPVRPGDTLSVRIEVLEKADEPSPERGLVRIRIVTENDDGETVLSMVGLMLIGRRESA